MAYLPWMTDGVPTLDWKGVPNLDGGMGYLPWMGGTITSLFSDKDCKCLGVHDLSESSCMSLLLYKVREIKMKENKHIFIANQHIESIQQKYIFKDGWRGVPTLDGERAPALNGGGGTYIGWGRGSLPWIGERVTTLDGGGGTYLRWGRGTYLRWGRGFPPWMGGTYLGWGVPTLDGGKGVPALDGGEGVTENYSQLLQ